MWIRHIWELSKNGEQKQRNVRFIHVPKQNQQTIPEKKACDTGS